MKINVSFYENKNQNVGLVARIPSIEIDVDTGSIFVDRNLSPRLSLKLKELATHLTAFYLDMEKDKC